MSDLRHRIRRRAIRVLAFEAKVIAAITAGIGISLALTVPAGIVMGLTLSALDLEHYANWGIPIIELCTFVIWLVASLKVYLRLERRSATTA